MLTSEHIIDLATNVANTGGFCLAMAVDPDGETVRLAVLPGRQKPYAVQVQHTWKDSENNCHVWVDIDAFCLVVEAADLLCHVAANGICEMSAV